MADPHHSLPLTQASERSPHVFVDASGSPLSVYIDVDPEILARPRLTRLLRVGIYTLTVMNVFVWLMLVIYHLLGIRSRYMPQSFGRHHPPRQPGNGIWSQVGA